MFWARVFNNLVCFSERHEEPLSQFTQAVLPLTAFQSSTNSVTPFWVPLGSHGMKTPLTLPPSLNYPFTLPPYSETGYSPLVATPMYVKPVYTGSSGRIPQEQAGTSTDLAESSTHPICLGWNANSKSFNQVP